jgi:hypothetical protein
MESTLLDLTAVAGFVAVAAYVVRVHLQIIGRLIDLLEKIKRISVMIHWRE